MTGKRPTPLKDEPMASLGELQDLLTENIAAINALNKTISSYTGTQPVSPEKIATAARNAVKELLEERQRGFEREEEEAKAQGKLTPQECYAKLSADYADVLQKCIIVCDTYKYIGEVAKRLNETRVGNDVRVRSVDAKLDIIIERLGIHVAAVEKTIFPTRPKRFKDLPTFVFKKMPLYCLRRAYRSRHVRQFVWICLLCIWLLTVGTAYFIAHDNAMLRKEIQRNLPQRECLEYAPHIQGSMSSAVLIYEFLHTKRRHPVLLDVVAFAYCKMARFTFSVGR